MGDENKNNNAGSVTPVKEDMSTMEPSSAIPSDSWEWGDLLDFSIGEDDDQLILSWETETPLSPPPPPAPPLQHVVKEIAPSSSQSGGSSSSGGKVRKRDPRLICENYLAGRVPCACPEMDKLEEEEAAAMAADGLVAVGIGSGGPVGRKKARAETVMARCQVPGCEVDISQLKGYHRRHRICLRCANAASVLLDGEPKRYCQQCGKFHVLADFDKGKRSCRRKLERHNKRRRRRPSDQKNLMEKENDFQDNTLVDNLDADDEQSKESLKETSHGSDSLYRSNKSADDTLQESGARDSTDPSNAAGHCNNLASFAISSEAQIAEKTDNTISIMSYPVCENKYPTMCPTGRISFKLYDWNPAEFPRQLRRQIFQWLDSMPVELEGYIRPGCTILTVFISMPDWMWSKLSKDTVQYLQNFVKAPESLFFGRGNVHIHLNNTIFQVLQDGNSLVNVKMEVQVPKLHYVHPVVFEAGKPMVLFACGSNLLQPNFRFLVSFAGKYLVHELEEIKVEVQEDISCDFKHEMLRIRISQTDSKLFGPAFLEVENESGLSNFIPILLADEHVCAELEHMKFASKGNSNTMSQVIGTDDATNFCGVSMSRRLSTSELLLDIAWLLKDPHHEDSHNSFFSIGNIKRLNSLFKCLVENGSVNILKKMHSYVNTLLNGKDMDDLIDRNDYDVKLFLKYMDDASKILHKKSRHVGSLELDHGSSTIEGAFLQYDFSSASMTIDQEKDEVGMRDGAEAGPVVEDTEEKKPLLVNPMHQNAYDHSFVKRHSESYNRNFDRMMAKTRLVILVMASVVVCFGFCIVLFHPHKAGEFAASVCRCVFGIHKP